MNRSHALLIAGVVAFVIVAGIFFKRNTISPSLSGSDVVAVPIEKIDPTNDERLVSLFGELEAKSPAHDPELGVNAPEALVLLRQVEMYQWQERCIADACGQKAEWSATLVDSSTFREQSGHVNPAVMPFQSKRFVSSDITLGAFSIAPELLASGLEIRPWMVRLSDLSPNLAASFVEFEGGIYSGENPLAPVVGDLRVSYAIVPAQIAAVTGVQRGQQLFAAPAASN